MDRDSFGKSTFIPREGLETTMTDSINAKMGDLSTAKDDINNFDRAVKAIDEARKNYTRRSKTNTGKLEIMKRQMRECNEASGTAGGHEQGLRRAHGTCWSRGNGLCRSWKEKSRTCRADPHAQPAGAESRTVPGEKRSLERHLADSAGLDAFFAAGIPKEDELKDMENLERRMPWRAGRSRSSRKGFRRRRRSSAQEMLFASSVPEEADLSQWNLWAGRLKELRVAGESHKLSEDMKAHLQEMSSFFERKLPQEEEMAAAEERVTELIKLEGAGR